MMVLGRAVRPKYKFGSGRALPELVSGKERLMVAVTLDALKTFGEGLDGKTLVTRFRKRRFSLSVSDRGFEYSPEHSGKPRMQECKWIERILERYNEKPSLHPADYKDLTVNASYVLTIIRAYLDSISAPIPI
jgi:hypothetical protein